MFNELTIRVLKAMASGRPSPHGFRLRYKDTGGSRYDPDTLITVCKGHLEAKTRIDHGFEEAGPNTPMPEWMVTCAYDLPSEDLHELIRLSVEGRPWEAVNNRTHHHPDETTTDLSLGVWWLPRLACNLPSGAATMHPGFYDIRELLQRLSTRVW